MESVESIEVVEVIESVELVESRIPNETAIIETIEPTKPIDSIEVSTPKRLET